MSSSAQDMLKVLKPDDAFYDVLNFPTLSFQWSTCCYIRAVANDCVSTSLMIQLVWLLMAKETLLYL